jgi:hypothetical protein
MRCKNCGHKVESKTIWLMYLIILGFLVYLVFVFYPALDQACAMAQDPTLCCACPNWSVYLPE